MAPWRPAKMNMRKWGRHLVNNSCHCASQQAEVGVGLEAMVEGGGMGDSAWYARPWHGTQTQSCHPCGNITLASTICALNTSVGTWQVLISQCWLFPLAVMPLSSGHTQHLVWVSVHEALTAHHYTNDTLYSRTAHVTFCTLAWLQWVVSVDSNVVGQRGHRFTEVLRLSC